MLASQTAGHHLSVLDTFQQILNRALADGISVKMRAISIGETRTMLALTRELRRVRKEMIAIAEAERDTMAVRPIAASEPRPEPPVEAPPVEAPLAEAPLAPQPSAVPPPSLAGIRHAAAAADGTEFAAHIADFENAMTAVQQTLEEARALDKRTATRANGHLAAVTPFGLAAARLSASG